MSAVRRFVAAQARACSRQEDAVLLASEAAANAVEHTDSPEFEVTVESSGDWVRVEVHDLGGTTTPQLSNPRDDDVRGRGIALIDALATRWGVTPTSPGTTVWFEVGASGGVHGV